MINIYEALKNYPNLSKQLHCKGMLFTNYDCPQSTKIEQYFVECNHIAFVISGKRIFHKNDKQWTLDEGSCVFVKKGTHIAERQGEDGWCVMAFFMPDDFLKQLVNENQAELPMNNLTEVDMEHVLPLDVNGISKSFFQSMLPYFTETPSAPENLLELKFKELVLSLLSNPSNNRFLSYLHHLASDQRPSMEQIMHNNYACNLTLPDYAKLTSKSVPTFKREFKRIFNDTPARWVLKKKLGMASQLLKNSQMSVAAITIECGFENQTHFSRVFKERIGISPIQYRIKARRVVMEDTY